MALYDVGVTGLALNALLVAGYDGTGIGPNHRAARRALSYLLAVQDPEGCLGARSYSTLDQVDNYTPEIIGMLPYKGHPGTKTVPAKIVVRRAHRPTYIYNHAAAALALVETYGITGRPALLPPAQRALDFIALARNPYFAWRYGVKPGDNDTSVTAWVMLALGCARMINGAYVHDLRPAPFILDEGAFHGVKAWVEKVTDPDYGRVGYVQRGSGPSRLHELFDRYPIERSESLTAAGMFMRMLNGESPRKSQILKLGAELCAKSLPSWNPMNGSIDFCYWHFGTLAMLNAGGKHGGAWSKDIARALLDNQRKDGDYCQYKGSWDPIGAWGIPGGRVYATAINALTLLGPRRFPSWR